MCLSLIPCFSRQITCILHTICITKYLPYEKKTGRPRYFFKAKKHRPHYFLRPWNSLTALFLSFKILCGMAVFESWLKPCTREQSCLRIVKIYLQWWKWSMNHNPENTVKILKLPPHAIKRCISQQVRPKLATFKMSFLNQNPEFRTSPENFHHCISQPESVNTDRYISLGARNRSVHALFCRMFTNSNRIHFLEQSLACWLSLTATMIKISVHQAGF